MHSPVPSSDSSAAGKARFQPRAFWRMLGLTWGYRRTLILGLLCTTAFAGLHTVGIGWAFPVFKVLLEPEGVRGWAHRTAAQRRLGVEFAPIDGPTQSELRVVSISEESKQRAPGLKKYDTIADAGGRSASKLLEALAAARPGGKFDVTLTSSDGEPDAEPRKVTLSPADADMMVGLLRRCAKFSMADTPDAKLRTLMYLMAGLIVTILIANVFGYFGRLLVAEAVLRSMMDLRGRLYERTLHLPMTFFAAEPASQLVTRFVQDVQEVQRGLTTLLGRFLREPLRAMFALGLALALDWRITLTLLVIAPFAGLMFMVVGRRVKRVNRKLLQTYGVMIGALTNTLQSLRVVKAYSAEDYERARLHKVDRSMFEKQMKLVKLEAFVAPSMEALVLVGGCVVTIWLASRVLSHDLSVSKFVIMGLLMSVVFTPLRKLSDMYVRIQRAGAGAERVFELLDSAPHEVESDAKVHLTALERSIDLEHVSFSYPGSDALALNDVSVSIRRGETVAFVGPNGSGKTTLISLLPRLYDVSSGRILYDGKDVRDASLKSLRKVVGLVSQEAVVFGGTPTENIAYGVASPDMQRVRDAARRASADEFIESLPGGYDAILGERGTTLSGGQRQRLAIARGIYRDTPILIFDEATSSVDTESERQIQAALREISKDRTVIIIAHRLSTIRFADRIIVMDAGRIVDSGTHAELIERCGLYQSLYEKQFAQQSA